MFAGCDFSGVPRSATKHVSVLQYIGSPSYIQDCYSNAAKSLVQLRSEPIPISGSFVHKKSAQESLPLTLMGTPVVNLFQLGNGGASSTELIPVLPIKVGASIENQRVKAATVVYDANTNEFVFLLNYAEVDKHPPRIFACSDGGCAAVDAPPSNLIAKISRYMPSLAHRILEGNFGVAQTGTDLYVKPSVIWLEDGQVVVGGEVAKKEFQGPTYSEAAVLVGDSAGLLVVTPLQAIPREYCDGLECGPGQRNSVAQMCRTGYREFMVNVLTEDYFGTTTSIWRIGL
jgi:hypothetical protein